VDDVSNSDESILTCLDSGEKIVKLVGCETFPGLRRANEMLEVTHRHPALAVNIKDTEALGELILW